MLLETGGNTHVPAVRADRPAPRKQEAENVNDRLWAAEGGQEFVNGIVRIMGRFSNGIDESLSNQASRLASDRFLAEEAGNTELVRRIAAEEAPLQARIREQSAQMDKRRQISSALATKNRQALKAALDSIPEAKPYRDRL